MRSMHRIALLLVLLSAGSLSAQTTRLGDGAETGPTSLPSFITDSAAANISVFNSLYIEWDQDAQIQEPASRVRHYKVVLSNGRFHYWRTAQSSTIEAATDGRVYETRIANRVVKQPASLDTHRSAPVQLRYFDDVGIEVPIGPGRMTPQVPIQSAILERLHNGGRLKSVERATVGQTSCIAVSIVSTNEILQDVLKAPLPSGGSDALTEEVRQARAMPAELTNIYFLDPAKGFCVRRWEQRFHDGTLIVRVDNDGFSQVGSTGVWLPRKVTEYTYWSMKLMNGSIISNEPRSQTVRNVTVLSTVVPPDVTFAVDTNTPGTTVIDHTRPNRTEYQIQGLAPIAGQSGSHLRWTIAISILLAFAAAIAYFGLKRMILARSRRG